VIFELALGRRLLQMEGNDEDEPTLNFVIRVLCL
jgi:hypothetical protein